DWPEKIVKMQRNWIGKSEGAEVDFAIAGAGESRSDQSQTQNPKSKIRIFTPRPDTLWGATFMVLAPEHPMVPLVTTGEQRAAVEAYVAQTKAETEAARTAETKEKTGVFTGGYAINPVNG